MARITEERDTRVVEDLGTGLRSIEDRIEAATAADLAVWLIKRMKPERDPDMLRALGDVLGDLPVDSLSGSQMEDVALAFAIPDAPCQIVARTEPVERFGQLARQILNRGAVGLPGIGMLPL